MCRSKTPGSVPYFLRVWSARSIHSFLPKSILPSPRTFHSKSSFKYLPVSVSRNGGCEMPPRHSLACDSTKASTKSSIVSVSRSSRHRAQSNRTTPRLKTQVVLESVSAKLQRVHAAAVPGSSGSYGGAFLPLAVARVTTESASYFRSRSKLMYLKTCCEQSSTAAAGKPCMSRSCKAPTSPSTITSVSRYNTRFDSRST
mmetsp:Transcript_15421/g.51987  ORF Transcript_15421/g.51987 Transcript_15421/m.51987 type:complete len:200 (+) Transcript_15421:730-1329(+)